jgi:hypothetical protein
MMRNISKTMPEIILLLFLGCVQSFADNDRKAFAFVDPQYIITAEYASEKSFVLNFINLSDFVIVVQPGEFIYRSESGHFYIGQVFEREFKDSLGEIQKYSASMLLKEHSYTGLNIVGAFYEQDQIKEMSVRIGAKRFYMQPLEKIQFDQLAAKIGELDLKNTEALATLEEVDIKEMGSVQSTDGTSEWERDWQGLISPEGVNPPKIIKKPEISPTEEARRTHTYGKVKLSGIINKSGGITGLKVLKGLGKGLDQRAITGVTNSWVFLPATKNGEVVETSIVFEVDFLSPAQK